MSVQGRCRHCARRGLLTSPSADPVYCDWHCEKACQQGDDEGHTEPTPRMLLNDKLLDRLEQIKA